MPGFKRDENQVPKRKFDRDRRSNNFGEKRTGSFRDKKPDGVNNGRIENFEKPLIQLLKDINEKLDILIKDKSKLSIEEETLVEKTIDTENLEN